jgi:tyrosyl-tRNA synthetase
LSKNQIQELTAYLKNTKSKLSGKMLKWQTKRERENVKEIENYNK